MQVITMSGASTSTSVAYACSVDFFFDSLNFECLAAALIFNPYMYSSLVHLASFTVNTYVSLCFWFVVYRPK